MLDVGGRDDEGDIEDYLPRGSITVNPHLPFHSSVSIPLTASMCGSRMATVCACLFTYVPSLCQSVSSRGSVRFLPELPSSLPVEVSELIGRLHLFTSASQDQEVAPSTFAATDVSQTWSPASNAADLVFNFPFLRTLPLTFLRPARSPRAFS